MGGKQIVERSADLWNDRDRAGFLACYATKCELVTPVLTGKGRDTVGEFWDTSMGIYPDNRVRVTLLVEEGESVVEEGWRRAPTPAPSRCRTARRPRPAATRSRSRSSRCTPSATG